MNKSQSFFKTAALVTALLIFTASSCSAFSFGTKTNKKYNEKKMKTLTGKTVMLENRDNVYTDQEFGFGFVVPEALKTLSAEGLLEILPLAENITFFTLYSQKLYDLVSSLNPETVTEEQWASFTKEAEKYAFPAAFLFRLPSGDPQGVDADILNFIKENYSAVEKIADFSGTAYYFGYNTDYAKIEFSDDEKNKAGTLIGELKDFKKNIFVFPPLVRADENALSAPAPSSAGLTSFQAQTLTGETVTQDMFKDYKVTMINIWATWCPPCVKEMPDLAKLHSSMLPEGTNMISICIDSDSDPDGARDILNKVSARFTTIVPNAGLSGFLSSFSAIPATVFVDSHGNLIGKPITGVPGRDPASAYAKTLADLVASQN